MSGSDLVANSAHAPWCGGDDLATAIHTATEQISYAELRRRVAVVHSAILNQHAATDTPVVGVLFPAGERFITSFLGGLEAGAVVIPLEPNHPPERLRQCIHEGRISLLITDDAYADKLRDLQLALPVRTYRELFATGYELQPAVPWQGIVLFTSGSTGTPKGVFLPGRMLITQAHALMQRLDITPADRVSHLLSPTVIGGLREIFSALLSGAALHPLSVHELGLDRLALRLLEDRITICRMVSTLLRSVCHALPGRSNFSLRTLYVGGEPLLNSDVALFRRVFPSECRLINVFGATEYGLATHYEIDPRERYHQHGSVPIGFPFPDYELHVVDDQGRETPRGEVGRLFVTGSSIALNYWNQASGQTSPFTDLPNRPGWRGFQTNDLVRINERGAFEFRGRADKQVKIRGNRVEIGEVESCLLSHPHVIAAAAVELTRDDVQQLYAVFVPRDGETPQLRQWCLDRLPSVAVPTEFIRVASLPSTTQGKADQRELRRMVEDHLQQRNHAAAQPKVAPGSASPSSISLPETLECIWRDTLRMPPTERLDPTQPFCGDSVALLELLLDVRKRCHVEIAPAEFATARTFAQFSALVARKHDGVVRGGLCIRLTERNAGPPLFLLHSASGECGIYDDLARAWSAPLALYGTMADPADYEHADSLSFDAIVAATINSLRAQQPCGPYRLAGYSFGGILAFETACRLRDEGDDVSFVGLIDSYLPYQVRYQAAHRDWGALVANAPRWLLDHLATGEFRHGIHHRAWEWLFPSKRLKNFGKLRGPRFELTRKLLAAIDGHRLSRWDDTLHLYRSRVRPLLHSHRLDRLWKNQTSGRIVERILPGNHTTMMKPPHLQTLANLLAHDVSHTLPQHPTPLSISAHTHRAAVLAGR